MNLITGRAGVAHITPHQDAMWHQGLIEMESCIFDAYENFTAEIITNNEVRIRSGVGMLQGRFFCIEPNTYDSADIANGNQGEYRKDLIVARITVDASTNTQSASIEVIQGTPAAENPTAPEATVGDLDAGDLIADYPLVEVLLNGINIESITPQFNPGWILLPETIDEFAASGITLSKQITGLNTALQKILSMAKSANNAGGHNSIFRGKNLTNVYTIEQICDKIADGSFDDLFIGDYFDVSIATALPTGRVTETVRCMLAGFDPYLYNGDMALTQHHAAIVPMNAFTTTAQMNTANVTTGGYAGSVMHKTTLPLYATALGNVFGDHLLTYRALLTNAVANGVASNWAWSDCKLRLMTEVELYGSAVWAQAGFNTGIGKSQLPLFSLAPEYIRAGLGGTDNSSRNYFWLSGVGSATDFATCGNYGNASSYGASYSYGVRPLFLIG